MIWEGTAVTKGGLSGRKKHPTGRGMSAKTEKKYFESLKCQQRIEMKLNVAAVKLKG